MVSSCMLRKVKKTRIVEAEKSNKESGDFMQLRSRRLYKSTKEKDGSMEAIKKREVKVKVKGGGMNSRSLKEKVKGKDGVGLKEEEMVVVEKEGGKVEEIVKVDEDGVDKFDPIDCGGGVEIEGVDVDVGPIFDGIGGEEGGKDMVGDDLVPIDREIREESTPEHLIMRPGYITAKGSNTGANRGDVPASGSLTKRRLQGGCVPSVKSIEDLFAESERQQEKLFMEKYNFDFKNESPIPGRYEWVKVEP